MLLERLPEVQSLAPEDKWRLIDELWSDLARQVEGAGPEDNIVELLEKRFSDYLLDPSSRANGGRSLRTTVAGAIALIMESR